MTNTPLYITELKNELKVDLKEFRHHVDTRFDSLDKKIESEVASLAASTSKQFRGIQIEIAEMKESITAKTDIGVFG